VGGTAFSGRSASVRESLERALGCILLLVVGLAPLRADAVEPLPTHEIAEGIHVYQAPYELPRAVNEGAIANVGFIIGRDAVAVIDTGGSRRAGQRLLAAVRARTALPIRYVINTHMHPDHVLGNGAFVAEGATFVGHHKLARALSARADTYLEGARRELGDTVFAGTTVVLPVLPVVGVVSLDLGDRRITLEAQATAHTDNDLTVFDQRTATWFLGDLLFMGHVPALDGRLKGWLAFIVQARQRRVARVVPGHGPASAAWPDATTAQEHYLRSLEASVREALKAGRSMSDIAAGLDLGEPPGWMLFDAFHARNGVAAYQELEWE
jgi:quinoprotein relay system zinc metallohydrolase 2